MEYAYINILYSTINSIHHRVSGILGVKFLAVMLSSSPPSCSLLPIISRQVFWFKTPRICPEGSSAPSRHRYP